MKTKVRDRYKRQIRAIIFSPQEEKSPGATHRGISFPNNQGQLGTANPLNLECNKLAVGGQAITIEH